MITDIETRNVTLINLIERISINAAEFEGLRELIDSNPENVIVLPITIVAVSYWWRTDPAKEETGRVRYRIKGPIEKVIVPPDDYELGIDLAETISYRTKVVFQGFPYVGDGSYFIILEILVDDTWKHVASAPFQLLVT
jgi:hypothetical protein